MSTEAPEGLSDRLDELLRSAIGTRSVLAYLLAYALGIFISFSPCVYPLVPIVVGYIGSVAGHKQRNAFLYSVAYVAGMAVVYCALGIAAAALGGIVARWLSQPWLVGVLGMLLIALGLWALGAFDIPVPQWLRGTGAESSRGSLLGSFAVGAASALVVGPCATPALGAMLSLIAASARERTVVNVIYGSTVMLVFALGMGTLLIICGTFSGLITSLPRAGGWLGVVKKVFGGLLIAAGLYFILWALRLVPSVGELLAISFLQQRVSICI